MEDFIDELKSLCSRYNVKITSICDDSVGTPHAAAYEKGDDRYYNIDMEEDGYEVGEELYLEPVC